MKMKVNKYIYIYIYMRMYEKYLRLDEKEKKNYIFIERYIHVKIKAS